MQIEDEKEAAEVAQVDGNRSSFAAAATPRNQRVHWITPGHMKRRGRGDGADTCWQIVYPWRRHKDPFPAVDATTLPPLVSQVREVGAQEMARLAGAHHREEDSLRRQAARLASRTKQLAGTEDIPATPPSRKATYAFLLVILGLGDFVLTRVIFAALGASRAETVLLAAVVAFAMPTAAHFGGVYLKRRNWLLAGLDAGAALIVAMVIASIRAEYMQGTGITAALGMGLGPAQLSALFFGLQAALFVIAVVASYAHTVQDPEAERRARELEAVESELAVVRERLENLDRAYEAEADAVNAGWRSLAYCYHAANCAKRARVDVAAPVWPEYLTDIPTPNFRRERASELRLTRAMSPSNGERTHQGARSGRAERSR